MSSFRLAALAAFAPLAFCQALPQFEVASIKPSKASQDFSVKLGYKLDGAMVTCQFMSLKDYIRIAWQLKVFQLEGPDWTGSERFDITAKLPEGGKESQIRDMMKSLLDERFHLKMHQEKKDFPVYALVVGKNGVKMTLSAVDPSEAPSDPAKPLSSVAASGGPQGVSVNLGRGSSFGFANNKLTGKKLTMLQFADLLARFEDRPVVDESGLPGAYDFEIEMTPEDYMVMQIRAGVAAGVNLPPQALHLLDMPSGDSFAQGLQALGLKLEPKKAPLQVFIIDSADKTPTDN